MLYIYLSALDTDEEKDYFEELYLQYRHKMYGIAYSILHNEQDSEDAVHQAFLKIELESKAEIHDRSGNQGERGL